MLFNSFGFLASFAAFVLVYYAVSRRVRWALLLAVSVGFYATFDLRFVPLLAGVAAVAYAAGRAIDAAADPRRRRRALTLGVALVLAALVTFKYLDFFAASLASLLDRGPLLPRLNIVAVAGLSFYTFSCVSYLADVHARRLPAERHFGHFALYVAFFPKILAGPIERARPFLAAVREGPVFADATITRGLQLMLWGLVKKVVIADRLALFVNAAYAQPSFAPPADLLLATYFFAFQLYCDFSGYSDIAIGASRVLGIDLAQNFRRPYLATSVSEFWAKRWHLSLSSWFRDYLFIPLGGSRVSAFRRGLNVMAVFLVSGLWHGANWTFVVWGALNGALSLLALPAPIAARLGPLTTRVPRVVRSTVSCLLTFHLILVTWVFFRAASLADATTILSRVAASASALPSLLAVRLQAPEVLVSVTLVAGLLLIEALDEHRSIWQRLDDRPAAIRWAAYYALVALLVVMGTWSVQQFVYMQF